ncbi:MAG TPA: GAF domain-containing protein [Candidatus Goldiibacteriota bacterium]|nr:GAF domain-containing protein [Candidatus Goldiibacteriota bacterium]
MQKRTKNNETIKLKRIIKEKDKEIEILKEIATDIFTLSLDEIMKKIIDVSYNLTKCDACFIYLFDNESKKMVLEASLKSYPNMGRKINLNQTDGIVGWVAENKETVVISEKAFNDPRYNDFNVSPEDGFNAILSMPILSINQLVGVLNIRHKKKYKYNDGIISLLKTITSQFAGIMENLKLKQKAEKKSKEIDTLSKISKTIASDRYLTEILNIIVSLTAEMMNSKICSIMLLDDDKQELKIIATQSLSEAYKNKPNVKVGHSISGKVVKEKRSISVLNVTEEPDYAYKEIAREEGLKSMLAVPMMVRNKVIGVINIYTNKEHLFSDDEIRILQSVANQAAIGIENMNLMQEAVMAKEALETRKLIERAKNILINNLRISEDSAYKTIHRQAMDSRKTMKEIAEAIILYSEIKK